MAMKSEEDTKSLSFKFVKSTKPTKFHITSSIKSFQKNEEEAEDIDYVVSTEGREIKSARPKKKHKELVIPLTGNFKGSKEDEEAANELLKDLKEGNNDGTNAKDVAIPLLMRNRLPAGLGEDGDQQLDLSLMPDESTADDYEDVPVTSFGAAMLRGMGWKNGEAIGLTNKGLSEPIEFIPRHKGLGLGAEKKQEEVKKKRRRLGESKSSKISGPIVEKSGKVRHFKGIGEAVYKHPQGFVKGAHCMIEKGIHKGIYGKIIATDEDNARVTVKLVLGGQQIAISQYNVSLVDEEEYNNSASGKRKLESSKSSMTEDGPNKKLPKNTDDANGYAEEELSWLIPHIRARIISKSFKKGAFYNRKVEVLDVVSRNRCICRTTEGRLLEDVYQQDLETVIPKTENALVMIVHGKYRGQIGKLMTREHKECRGYVQLLSNKHVTRLDYDFISEYLGSAGDDDFL